ncbi:MAG: PAS domain-containing protein [Alphaproteobacteria bacterium]|uniref:PAS domain-containing protein n=1 Tax=Pyruvatibacter sp. HU-CL02332 TaxID=3127650 RepID=UPI002969680E|nr:PAS domain-containing protein [Alphaproteobacteria bacterium]
MLQKKPKTLGYSSGRVDAPSHMNNQALLAYWEEKRPEGQPLMRSDFDPLQLPKLLPCLFLAKPLGDDYQFRLVGSQIEERMRRALTNQTLTGVYGPDFGPKTVESYRHAATTCEPLTLRGNYVGDNLEHIDFEVLHLAIQFEDGSRGVIGGQFAFD